MRIRTVIVAVAVIACTTILLQKGTVKAASEDRPQIGTLNGQPLLGVNQARAINTFVAKYNRMPTSADNSEVAGITAKQNCPLIQGAVKNAARETEKHSLGIYASPDEIAQASSAYWALNGDPKVEFTREQTRQLTRYKALTAVFDQHQDPAKVYQTMLAPIGESQIGWESDLKRTQWQWPQIKDSVAKQAAGVANWTLEGYMKTKDAASQKLVEDQKLDDAVDNKLAAQDPQFRTDLNEYRKQRSGNVWLRQGAPGSVYLAQARQQFWQSRYAQQQLTLNDPNLVDQCQTELASVGFKTQLSKP